MTNEKESTVPKGTPKNFDKKIVVTCGRNHDGLNMENITKRYSNGEVTIVWSPSKCIHSGICFRGLPDVFNPKKRPWVKIDASETSQIVEQVKKCPSGALSFFLNNENDSDVLSAPQTRIEAKPDGPIIVYGNVVVKDAKGNSFNRKDVTALCRCGHSANKPFCDGSHSHVGFKDSAD